MKSLVKLAENEEAKAAADMKLATDYLSKVQNSLEGLVNYQNEYIGQFQQNIGKQFSINQLNQYRNFLSQLTMGIEQQQQVIARAHEIYEKKRRFWLEKHNRTRALKKAMENYHLDEQNAEEIKEQNLQDEFSMQKRNRDI